MSESQPFQEGLFRIQSGAIQLIGSKCQACGRVVYPAASVCLDCGHEKVEPFSLSNVGKLYSFTTVHMPVPHFKPPFHIGYIALPEGLRIFAPIADGTELKVGLAVRLAPAVLWREEEKDMVGYRIEAK